MKTQNDKITLQGMKFYGFHGVNPEEKTLGQTYLVDCEVTLDLSKAGISDNLNDTVSYTHIYRVARSVIEGESKNLLEALAESIANKVINEFKIQSIRVSVVKPNPPIKGSNINQAAVEIIRHRADPID